MGRSDRRVSFELRLDTFLESGASEGALLLQMASNLREQVFGHGLTKQGAITVMTDSDKQFKAHMALIRKAEKLEGSEAGYSRVKKAGYIKLANGAWRDPAVQDEMIALYTKALALDKPPYWSLQLRATTRMLGGFLDDALADLKLLEEKKSNYATGIFPLQLYLLRGDKETAQRYLDEINARNKSKGMPKQKFSDFRLD